MAQDTVRLLKKQDKNSSLKDCESSQLPSNLADFSQAALLKLALNLYFQNHPAEDEVSAFAAYLSHHTTTTKHESLKSHLNKVIAGQTSMCLDYWLLLDEFVGVDVFEPYVTVRRTKLQEVKS